MIDAAAFRLAFPEFADPVRFSDQAVAIQVAVAKLRLPVDRWAELYDHGCTLFVAHAMSLQDRANRSAAAGGSPGAIAAPLTAKAVDKVSASYDTSAVSLVDGGYWNQTSYGIQFLQLARLIGAGGIQL